MRHPHFETDDATFNADAYQVAGYRGIAWYVLGWETEPDEDTEWSGYENRTGNAFWRRADFDPYYPCVESPEAWIFIGRETSEYPDRIMRLGKRGGVVVERA